MLLHRYMCINMRTDDLYRVEILKTEEMNDLNCSWMLEYFHFYIPVIYWNHFLSIPSSKMFNALQRLLALSLHRHIPFKSGIAFIKIPVTCVWRYFSSITLSRPNYPEHYFASNTLGILEEKQLAAWKRKPQKLHKASLIPWHLYTILPQSHLAEHIKAQEK